MYNICSVCVCVITLEIARHQVEQQRLAQKLREQEDRLKGLNAAQTSMGRGGGGGGLLPMIGGAPAPLFPPMDPTVSHPPPSVCVCDNIILLLIARVHMVICHCHHSSHLCYLHPWEVHHYS